VAELFAGVMSGTSLDGADAVIVDFPPGGPRTLGFATVAFSDALRERLLTLSQPGSDTLDLAGDASAELAALYARAVTEAMAAASTTRAQVRAIGCHGQTVRHRPERGFSTQLNDPARVAELTGIDVVADFRRRDIAAGGQGAPLVPAFHDAVFRSATRSRTIVNIGGISNISWLPAGEPFTGFDCGPGNVLLDAWARRHLGVAYDADGAWAARGRVIPGLLGRLKDEAYFRAVPPKSTGRELFNTAWLDAKCEAGSRPEDVQATLVELSAAVIAEATARFCPGTEEIHLCGGGARNPVLVSRLRAAAAGVPVGLTDALGIPTGQVECAAFAWLAMKCVRREPLDLRKVTGARGPRILGAVYPA